MYLGEEYFWKNGYSFFYTFAANIASGKGIYYEELGPRRAFRVPVYPVFLAATTLVGKSYLWIVVPQALFGAGTVLCAFLIGRLLFRASTGVLAALLSAVYPYYLMHDTALQETGLFTFLTALSVYLLLHAGRMSTWSGWGLAGLCLGLAVLTRVALLPFVVLACLWSAFSAGLKPRQRAIAILTLAASFTLIIAPWLARNWLVLGRLMFTSEAARALWRGNNAYTFSHYPAESIDESDAAAMAALSPQERRDLENVTNDEIRQYDWFAAKASRYIRQHPWLTFAGAFRKLWAAFSWTLNPRRGPAVQTAYALSYLPIAILGGIGMIASRGGWPEHSIIYLLFPSFAAVTMLYFGHTSHRSYLDVYLIVFAAHTIEYIGMRKEPQS
jgi:4-amino-4-deoxy-L-arabinose transferase-like glycosyltransferase